MGEIYITRKGGVVSDTTAAPTITIISEADELVFTLTNNDDNTAIISYDIDTSQGAVELAAAATSSNITVALAAGTYTLTAYATVVGEVASTSDAAVEIVQIFEFELLYDSDVSATLPLTQIDITGLNITKDDELRLVYTITPAASISGVLQVFPNDLTTGTNYHNQFLRGNGSTISAARANLNAIASAEHDNIAQGFADIKVSNNDRFVVQSQQLRAFGSTANFIQQFNYNLVGTQTVTSITKLTVSHSSTNGIGTGSRIRLYKVNTGEA
jgi:hypothetical protein